MRIDLGLVSAIVLEYILFVFYADTLFYRKRNKWVCYGIIGLGYTLHFICCMFGNVIFNTLSSAIILFLCFIICYHINIKNAIFQSALLVALCLAAEVLIVSIPNLGIVPTDASLLTPMQSIVLTLTSRTIYLVGVMILSRVFFNGKQYQSAPSFGLLIIPLLSAAVIILITKTGVTSSLMSAGCLILMVINVIIFIINQKLISKELEISDLKEQLVKEQIDFEEHILLKEKYRSMEVFYHDFKEHINTINALIDSDNEQAKQYIQSFCEEEENSKFIDYSDNKILNVLLSKKKIECQTQGIDFLIDPIQSHLLFIKDMDVVSIFSNLINNAMESCNKSINKRIYMNISTKNDNFIVIRVENTAETKPLIIDGKLKTHKDNKKLHGIGMNSIRRALKNYNGYLKWDYDEKKKFFCTTIVIQSV